MEWMINDVFPIALSITREERELWTEDPIQFVNQVYDVGISLSSFYLYLYNGSYFYIIINNYGLLYAQTMFFLILELFIG